MTFDPRTDPGYPGDAQPDLFAEPNPLEESAWTEFDHDGHRWRHRLHPEWLHYSPGEYLTAPGPVAWELEEAVGLVGTWEIEWRAVGYVDRKDEIWRLVLEAMND